MIQVRYGMFETNSSSTHSIFIVTEEEYEKLEKGELLINIGAFWRGGPDIITKEEAINELNKACPNWKEEYSLEDKPLSTALYGYDIAETLEHHFDDEYLESYEEHFTTPSGDKMVVFGKFGRDG